MNHGTSKHFVLKLKKNLEVKKKITSQTAGTHVPLFMVNYQTTVISSIACLYSQNMTGK